MKTSSNIHEDISDGVISLLFDKASLDDDATYSVRMDGSDINHGEVDLIVIPVKRAEEKDR